MANYTASAPATRFSEMLNADQIETTMSGALPVPSVSSSEKHDSCSPNYVSGNRVSTAPSTKLGRRATLKIKTKRVFRAIGRTFKKAFRVGTKKTSSRSSTNAGKHQSFIMPHEMAARNSTTALRPRSSVRSRLIIRKKTKMTASAPSPTPSQTLAHLHQSIGASWTGGTESKRSSAGTDAPSIIRTSPSGKRLTVHSHTGPISEPEPVRRSVLIAHPATTDVIAAPATPMTVTTVADSDDSWSTISESDNDSSLDFAGQVNPTEIYRTSFMGQQIEGSPEAFRVLCDRIDGFRNKIAALEAAAAASPRPQLETAQTAPELPYLSKMAPLSLESESESGNTPSDHRLDALMSLTGGSTVSEPASIDDIIAASPAEKKSHPNSLTPGKLPPAPIKRKPISRRPASTGGLYLAYPGGRFNPFNEPLSASIVPAAAATSSENATTDSNRSSTPCDFADTETHKKHYSRVESGIFESAPAATELPPRPANPTPDDRFSYFNISSPTSSGAPALPPTPPLPPSSIKCKAVGGADKSNIPNYSKKLPPGPGLNKPLPPTPGKPSVPQRLSMNANGYPMLNRNSASNFSLEPQYQRRSINDVEAKFKRETAKKSKSGKKTSEEKQKEREQRKQVKAMSDAIGKLMLCGTQ